MTPTATPTATPTRTAPALPPTTGRYWYVSATGDDGRDGRTAATALRTPQRAADRTEPGDTVLLMDGTYTNADPNGNVLSITRDGRADRPITYAAYPGSTPLIKVRNWTGVLVGASYVTVQGLTVRGNSRELTLAGARGAGAADDPVFSGGGISVTNPYDQPDRHPHDVVVRGNTVSDCPGGGIYSVRADRLTVEDNVVSGNARYSTWANSGIAVYQAWNSDTSTGYKIVVRRNVVHDNENLLPFRFSDPDPAKRVITDGNGIIIDDGRNTQDFVSGKGVPYTGRVLVENNVVYRNGGRGIHVYSSDHVDVVNNTTFENSRSPAIADGELTAFDAADVRFLGNAVVPLAGRPAVKTGTVSGLVQAANVTGAGVRFADPAAADFRPAAGSAAVDAGGSALAPATDILGRARPLGKAPDAGAYEVG